MLKIFGVKINAINFPIALDIGETIDMSAIITQKIWMCTNKPVAFEVVSMQLLLCYAH